jgi:DNA polymerase
MKALIAWWDEAGIPLDDPIVRPKPARAGAPAQSARQAATPQVRPARGEREATNAPATAAAARAAGFGQPQSDGPSALELAAKADTLDALKSQIEAFEGCALKRTARNTVFSRGSRDARVMIIGEAPGKDEDEQGHPFAGQTGQLLDRMLATIGLGPDDVYISNILNWRPTGNRTPTQEEVELCLPFIERHIALKSPDILVLAGGITAQALLRSPTGIMRLRGQWHDYAVKAADGSDAGRTIPAIAMYHPSYLLRRAPDKQHAWHDLLELEQKLV